MKLHRKHILGLQEMSAAEIQLVLDTAAHFQEVLARTIRKVPTLRGKTVCTLFWEPSTRTRASFEMAAKILSADTTSLTIATSSVTKGESLKDTVLTMQAMGVDCFIIRHPNSGAPEAAARYVRGSVINAGDGCHEHPTQGLLDLLTIRERKGRIDDLKVTIIGDLRHSRVARSDLWGLLKMGAHV
ncbi:MAG: aspartate carbamoyltransferase, partial [Armatimonadota bacterium]|nr:aspartate carbamoyltransferase [Armatimonadota bacterium]